MRRIFINGRFLSQPVTGAQRYSLQLLKHFDVLLEKMGADRPRVTVLVPAATRDLPLYRHLAVVPVGRFAGHLWEQVELPFYARGGLLFTPSGGAPVLHRRNIITIHDAAVIAAPQGYSFGFSTWYQVLYWVLCRSALHVFTVSCFSQAELVKWYGARPQKISVTYLGSEHALLPTPEPAVLTTNKLRPRGYVFAVGSSNANKNLAGLMRALPYLAGSGLQVAIAGHKDVKVFGKRNALDGVHDLGYVNESELRTLYENAACFVFPSFYEGFGLRKQENMEGKCGLNRQHRQADAAK